MSSLPHMTNVYEKGREKEIEIIREFTFIHDEFVGSRRPLKVTVSSECGDNEPVILITGIFNVLDDCGVPDGVRAICKSVRCM